MYGMLTLIIIFSVISPIFRTCFLQHYYINILYRQMPYSTVTKLNIIYFFVKGHTTKQFFLVIGEVTLEEGSMHVKLDILSSLRCNFLFLNIITVTVFSRSSFYVDFPRL